MSSSLLPQLDMNGSDSMGAASLSIALIGPDQERRTAVAAAMARRPGAQMREFPSYPPALDDINGLVKLAFNVIAVDLDSNPDYAIQIVERICSRDSAVVMVYSAQVNQELAVRCRQAGAREYLEAPFSEGVLDALERAAALGKSSPQEAYPSGGRQFVFFGAKGGSGTTTIACNYALALTQVSRWRTLLIDLGLPLGDAALNLGLASEYSTDDALRDPERLDPSLLEALVVRHSSGISVLAAPPKVPEADPSPAAIQKLLAVARTVYDYLVIDVGSRVDLVNTALFAEATTIYMVTQAGISELRNADRLLSLYFNDHRQNLEIVVNRFDPGDTRVTEEQMASALGAPMRWKIPDDYSATRQLQNAASTSPAAASPFTRLLIEMAGTATGSAVPEAYAAARVEPPATEASATRDAAPDDAAPAETPAFLPGGLPAVTWHTPEPIEYGTPLGDSQLNATAAIPGTFVYTPGSGYQLPVGTHTLWVTFTPDSGPMVQSAVSIVVSKVMPTIEWQPPAPIACDLALGDAQLNATASVPGRLDYSPAAGKRLEPGEHTLTVSFTPDDHKNYAAAKASVTIRVDRITPAIAWPRPAKIPFGGALSARHLNASASIPGAFVYQPRLGEVMEPGEHAVSVVFTPADTVHYTTAEASVTVTVMKPPPRVSWSAPAPIVYGTALSTAQLNATASVEGTFEYMPGVGAVLAVGEHTPSVTFTPLDDSDYGPVQAAVPLTVVMARPAVVWPGPAPITGGTPLGADQLNAASQTPGAFVYKPAAGEVLPAGTHTLSAMFTPFDSMNYEPVHATVTLTVTERERVEIKWPTPHPVPYGTALSDQQLNATASVPGSFAYGPSAGNVLPAGRHMLSAIFTPADRARYSAMQASVPLQVEALPDAASILATATHAHIETPAVAGPPTGMEREPARPEITPVRRERAQTAHTPAPAESRKAAAPVPPARAAHAPAPPRAAAPAKDSKPRETRSYKGVVYEKGEDGQWHRVQK